MSFVEHIFYNQPKHKIECLCLLLPCACPVLLRFHVYQLMSIINNLSSMGIKTSHHPWKFCLLMYPVLSADGRLSRLQQAPSSRQLVSSLQSGREDQLARLLSADLPASTPDTVLTEPVTTGYLQRRLLPHTVPLSSDELLQLLQEDQLQHQADRRDQLQRQADQQDQLQHQQEDQQEERGS